MASQLLDSVIFTLIAFWGLLPQSEFVQIPITTYLAKLIVAAIDTPLLHLARFMFSHSMSTEDEEVSRYSFQRYFSNKKRPAQQKRTGRFYLSEDKKPIR